MRILSNDYASNVPADEAFGHGGPALFAGAFSDFVAGRGHAWVGIVLRAGEAEDGETSFREEAVSGAKTYLAFTYPRPHLQAFMTSRRALDPRIWFAPQIDALRKLIRHAQPDILFLNGFSVFAWMILEAARLEGLPVVSQHAGIARVEFEVYKHLYSAAARGAVLKMEQEIVQVAAKQVFLNAFSRDAFCKRVAPVPKAQSVIIPLPYQKRFLAKAPALRREKGEGSVVIGCVARWDRIKNLDAFLRLAKEAGRRGLGWKFRAVTKIPETKIQKRFKDAFRKTIEIVPPMPPEELLGFYRSVDLLVLPSKFDVSPTVVMEAALQGKTTAISPTVGWVSEYRAHGLRAAVIDFSDESKALDRLRALLKKAPSQPFLRKVRVDHAPARVFAAYLRLFRSVI
jgi:glycosyltransferase involved in cell wall biosynthesis